MAKSRFLVTLTLLLSFALIGWVSFSSCAPVENPAHNAIREWVKQEYGSNAKVEIAGELKIDQTDMPNLSKWRGGIILENEKKDGIFFYNAESGAVDFKQGMEIPLTKMEAPYA